LLQVTTPARSFCALVAYDGTDYHGFQYQQGAATVQADLEMALDRFCQRSKRVVGAGRTDSGVHANGQVVRADLLWEHSAKDLERAWNASLPPLLAVRRVREAPPGFHPRFDALSRTYQYRVQWYRPGDGSPAARMSPLTDRFAWLETRSLDLEAMNAAASFLIGQHDFATFGQPPEGESTERAVIEAHWQIAQNAGSATSYPGALLLFTITANAFLRQMVRNLVGTLLTVGRGERPPTALQLALAARNRRCSAPPAAARGLFLERVTYPPELDRWIYTDALG
jgi:tRNA pseudouridine38-40 synthase